MLNHEHREMREAIPLACKGSGTLKDLCGVEERRRAESQVEFLEPLGYLGFRANVQGWENYMSEVSGRRTYQFGKVNLA